MNFIVCCSVMSLCGPMIMQGARDHGRLDNRTLTSDEACHGAPQGKRHGQQQQKQDTKIFQGNLV